MRVGAILSVTTVLCLTLGCAGVQKSLHKTEPTKLNETATHRDLISLPEPSSQVVVGVYKFQDQTGQFKPKENATSFSTAVTQGGTSMLVKALSDSGYFVPIEREGLPNLLNERKIIQSTRQQNAAQNGGKAQILPPLLFSSILMEGGIISYDTNVVTGGLGAEYFGTGGSAEIRRDQVTIYLRAVSVKDGRVLGTVSTSKTILSQRMNFNFFRFVSYQRLFEAEVGFTTNEPPQMAVLEAIERAVIDLIVYGLENNLWSLKNPDEMDNDILQRYMNPDTEIQLTEEELSDHQMSNNSLRRQGRGRVSKNFR